MKTKKIWALFIISIVLVLAGTTKSEASLYLNNLDFQAQINADGSMDVVETWDINVSDTNTMYKTFKIDKSKYKNLTNIVVTEITNDMNKKFQETETWRYHLEKDYYFGGINHDGEYEIAWGVSAGSYSTKRIFQIKYTIQEVVHKHLDCSELYWQFLGENFEISADNITGTIKLPMSVSNANEIKVWGHTKYLNGEIYATSADTIEFSVKNYKSGNYVETRIVIPNYVVNNLEYTSYKYKLNEIIEEETNWANKANETRKTRDLKMKIAMIIIIAITGAIGIISLTKIKKYKQFLKDNPKIKPEEDWEYYRELPDETSTPAEAIFMLKKGYNQTYLSNVFSATILDLTLKKYIEIKQEDKKITMKILKNDKENLPEDEYKVLKLLKDVAKDDVLTMKDLEKYVRKYNTKLLSLDTEFNKISKEKAFEKQKYSSKKEKTAGLYIAKMTGYFFLIIATFIAIFLGIGFTADFVGRLTDIGLIVGLFTQIILIIDLILVCKIVGRFNGFTEKGVNESKQWQAFKKYMEDFSYLNEKEVPHLVVWEKYLVFATAFGIAEKVLKQLKVKYPELNNQETINNMVLFNVMYNSNGFNTKFINSISSSTARMYSSTYSSGTGSGGGFSGGGGFGGGGGGRRWKINTTLNQSLKKNEF